MKNHRAHYHVLTTSQCQFCGQHFPATPRHDRPAVCDRCLDELATPSLDKPRTVPLLFFIVAAAIGVLAVRMLFP